MHIPNINVKTLMIHSASAQRKGVKLAMPRNKLKQINTHEPIAVLVT